MTLYETNSELNFRAYPATSGSLQAAAGTNDPENPFLTAEYSRARSAMGEHPIMLSESADVPSTVGFLRSGRVSRHLDIPSLPKSPSAAFLSGLALFCKSRGIYETTLNTYASPPASIPPLPHELERSPRTEFAFDLRQSHDHWAIGRTHRQRIRQAERLGLQVARYRSGDALAAHQRLINASIRRRQERGEQLETQQNHSEASCLLESGAAEIFQAVMAEEILSSMLVLRAPKGGYDHSSGTSPEGMAIGASHFLIFSVARLLQSEGCTTFNLGGARETEQGLRAFKAAFGTRTIQGEIVRASLCSASRRIAIGAVHAALRHARPIKLPRVPV